jgi:hypothetical protein
VIAACAAVAGVLALAQPGGADEATPSPAGTEPFSAEPASGPPLTARDAVAIARRRAAAAGDSEAGAEVAQGSLASAQAAVDPSASGAASPGPGLATLMQSSTYTVVMHGRFTLALAHVPRGQPLPGGSVLDVVVDARNGFVDGIHVGDTAPSMTGLSRVAVEP